MIKLERLPCPPELTDEIKVELTQIFRDTGKDVWKDKRIEKHLKNKLLIMSHQKCSYCECELEIESKYSTIEHILPKSLYKDLVLEWRNLLISCQRCNSHKTNTIETIINPCTNDPREHLWMDLCNFCYRIYGKKSSDIGQNSVRILDLNNLERIRKVRFNIGEKIKERAEDICKKIHITISEGKIPHYSHMKSLMNLMEEATRKASYAATCATVLLNFETFQETVRLLKEKNYWNEAFENLYQEIESIKLDISDVII
jgi:uncharacterized protein (TIGR02646 family)